ncbi:MAG TPA: TspO/MBR family protein [Methanoregula sp.]|nr:TspO/MBR family protein [Methanoregula sp.]
MESSSYLKGPALLKLAAAILFCEIAGSLGSVVTIPGPGSWYSTLMKPFFAPPAWIFGPVWVTLFALMGIALFLVWELGIDKPEVRFAVSVFAVQFAFNIAWSFLFFGLKSPLLGLIDIIILWWLILATIMVFYRLRKGAAYLLIPYLAWVSIATVLNASLYLLNP